MNREEYLKSVDTAVDSAIKAVDKNPNQQALAFAKKMAKRGAEQYYRTYPEDVHTTNKDETQKVIAILKALQKQKQVT